MEERQLQTNKDILVDGHTILYNPGEEKIECVFTELDCRFYTDLIYYNAPAELIQQRRRNDQAKKRILDLDIIKKELHGERNESLRIAKACQMGWYEIFEDSMENMQEKLGNLLSQLHHTPIRKEAHI